MELGEVNADADAMLVTHIDPLAEHPPNDIVVSRHSSLQLAVARPADLTSHLASMISGGGARRRLAKLLGDIQAWNLECDMRPLFDKLAAGSALPEEDRRRLVGEIVDGQGQRILNLMRYVARGLASKKSGSPVGVFFGAFGWLVAADGSSSSGLNKAAEYAVLIVKVRLADEIFRELPSLTLDRLSMLLGGGPGAAIAGEVMMELILGKAA